eukprot:c19275_g1_i3 orf=271-993(+)
MPETGDGDVAPTEIDAVLENLPAFSDSAESSSRPRNRLFGRERPVHHLLGGGRAADVLLWRKKHVSGGILVGSTVLWVLFVWMGCYLLSTLSTAMLAILFFLSAWSNAAAFLHRSPPPIPKVELSEEQVRNMVKAAGIEINKLLAILYRIVTGKDLKLFLKVVLSLWILSEVGEWFDFLSFLYLGILVSHTLPAIYEKHEDVIEEYARKALDVARIQYKKFDVAVLSKIPRAPTREQKTE